MVALWVFCALGTFRGRILPLGVIACFSARAIKSRTSQYELSLAARGVVAIVWGVQPPHAAVDG